MDRGARESGAASASLHEKSHFKKHILPARIAGQEFGDMYLAALAIHHIQELQDSLKAKRIRTKTKDGKISEKTYKHASINNYMKALQAMLKDARRKGLITIDLFDRDLISKLPENDRETEIDPYLPEEREAILKGFREHRPHYHGFVFHQFSTAAEPAKPVRSGARILISTTVGSESKKAGLLAMKAEPSRVRVTVRSDSTRT